MVLVLCEKTGASLSQVNLESFSWCALGAATAT